MTSSLSIQQEPPDTPDAQALVAQLNGYLGALYKPENQHGLSLAALQDASVIFLVARWDGVAVGCGAVKFFENEYAEIKRMYVSPALRRRGVAKALLSYLETLARENQFRVLRLETGIYQPEAVRLYEQMGFSRCPAFGNYQDDGISLCYEKLL